MMQGVSVIRDDQTRGTVVGIEEHGYLIIEFEDSSRIIIAQEMLIPQGDDTYSVPFDINLAEQVILPVITEEITIEKEQIPKKVVRVHKRVETREKEVDATTVHEEVIVERIPINRLVEDTHPKVRKERGVLIIPVVEEVVVIEKRLLLVEEVHISKQRTQKTTPHSVMLRREVIEVETQEADGTELSQNIDFEDI
ncbi:YsnF/AvaK domain-containing protein [Gloeocapsa sp. PCC 73106]|uniref:YsnF/AvaK domain-containing protein n=1 Tax=Gloeocapsa sp. PCC 73106 TaxID=102232 RepID=UPI0002ACCD1A|nr:YsnF/AvaK domain-containing protein [Gloeocapsa sp. PCC 73106]ELR97171.1 hypothetical protein GLO73106DRAFT_00009760 [Gloeocapsa sp. PCC 73106]